jgi:hypothetical protein
VKDENARLLYSREPGEVLPIEIVNQAPMIGIPPLEKGPFALFPGKPSSSAASQRSKTRKPAKQPPHLTLMAHKALKAHTSTPQSNQETRQKNTNRKA